MFISSYPFPLRSLAQSTAFSFLQSSNRLWGTPPQPSNPSNAAATGTDIVSPNTLQHDDLPDIQTIVDHLSPPSPTMEQTTDTNATYPATPLLVAPESTDKQDSNESNNYSMTSDELASTSKTADLIDTIDYLTEQLNLDCDNNVVMMNKIAETKTKQQCELESLKSEINKLKLGNDTIGSSPYI